jgi:hypothetical protein
MRQDLVPDGRPPRPEDPERNYLLGKIAECRRTCEWLGGLGIAYVLSAIIRAPQTDIRLRHVLLVIGGLQIVVSLFGAWPLTSETNTATIDDKIKSRFLQRRRARFISALLLAVALGILAASAW